MPKNRLPFELFKRKLVFVVIELVDVVTPVTSSPAAILTFPERLNPPLFSCILASLSSLIVFLKSINAPADDLEISIEPSLGFIKT